MKKEKKDQFVIACLEKEADAGVVLPMARHCAEKLGKGLFVLNVTKDGDNNWIKNFGIPYIGLKGDWKTAVDGLPTALGGVLAITAVDVSAPRTSITHPATMLRTFRDCKIAYMAVTGDAEKTSTENISTSHFPISTFITLDHRRESKEKLIWASYMVRFFGSRLTVATPAYSDEGFREKLGNNLLFMQKMYRTLDVGYTTESIPMANFKHPDMVVATETELLKPGDSLLIAMTTDRRDRDLGDLVAGPAELRLMKRCRVPILFLNQRDDLYVLCD